MIRSLYPENSGPEISRAIERFLEAVTATCRGINTSKVSANVQIRHGGEDMGKRNWLAIAIISVLSIFLASCGNLPTSKTPDANASPQVPMNSNEEIFMIKKEDISSVTISTGENDPISGVIDKETDIYHLVSLLNNAVHLTGDATADYYRLVKLNMKDGSVKALEFGGHGQFFKVLDSGVFFKLEPPENHKKLNKLIDRVEKEYQLKH